MNQKPPKTPSYESGGKNQPTHAAWPSVERQLVESKVIAGSALENLIRNNQDLSILRPEEANDGFPFPPWLRVYWRKTHPELDFSGPRVGYPLILGNILNWMTRHQDLPSNSPSPATPANNKKPAPNPSRRS
jgi:hypothetical protein